MATVVNNSLETDNFHNHQYLKLIINISTLLCTIFAIIISILIIIYICINLLQKNNLKKSTNISLLLICNTCLAIICSSISLTLMILSNIGGDMNIYILKRINHWACHIRGYLHFVFINSIYLSYALQGSFRLLHIAFHKYRCLRKIYSFSSFIIVQWIASFLFILPILIEYENYSSFIVYLPQEFYCQVPITNIRGTTFLILSVYFVPLCCVGIIYLWIIIHIKNRNRQIILIPISVQHKNKRDNIIIKRICLIMIVLSSLGVTPCLFIIAFIMTDHLHWTSYRISWMTVSISFVLIILSSLYVTPQIYKSIRIMFNHSQKNRKYYRTFSSINQFSSIDCALFTCRVQQHHTTGKNSFYMVYSAEAKLSSDEQNTITYHVQQNNQLVQQCLDSNAIKMKIYYDHQLKDHIDEIQPND
ncbi:unnamed protein product [Rotaria sordida]|uniref:G-protein coupled receptors family 1 profile domain-containing protein n=1 Tax=Rotaria sordida TaxID=392033 RepID=A0A814G1Q1_9BILA|nr:unnamed protein product [Rotaria sordida]CAF3586911.1 unnamed protein product [Rotaria sordida]